MSQRMSSHLASRAKDKAFELALSKQVIPGVYQRFMPAVGDYLVIQLPGETMRVLVKKIISPDAVLVHLDSVPMAKSHTFEFDKTYGARRRNKDGRDVWEAQKDREFLEEQARIVGAQETPKPKKRLPPEALKAPAVVAKRGRK